MKKPLALEYSRAGKDMSRPWESDRKDERLPKITWEGVILVFYYI